MNRWILFVMLLYSCIAGAQSSTRSIGATPYCVNEHLTIKEAPPEYKGKGEVSEDGFTVVTTSKVEPSVFNSLLLKAYENQRKNGCVVKDLEDLLKRAS